MKISSNHIIIQKSSYIKVSSNPPISVPITHINYDNKPSLSYSFPPTYKKYIRN